MIVTYQCNFRCSHCDIWKDQAGQELNTNQWIKIIHDLRKWLGDDYPVAIGGGEPLLRKDIFEIVKALIDNNFIVTLETNGYLIDKKTAELLVQSGIHEVRISLYSFSPALHNKMRGVPNAHEKAVQALRLLSEAKKNLKSKMKISIGLLLNKENIGQDALGLIKWANEQDFHVVIQALDENFRGGYKNESWFAANPLWPQDKEKVRLFFDELIKMKKAGSKIDNSLNTLIAFRDYFFEPKASINLPCPVGQRTMNIDPAGHLFFCYKTSNITESLAELPVKRLWRSKAMQEKRKFVKDCQKVCRIRCYYSDSLMNKINNYIHENEAGKNN